MKLFSNVFLSLFIQMLSCFRRLKAISCTTLMIEFDCRTEWIFSWKVSVQDASVRGTKPNCWVRQGNPKARVKPAQVATTRLPPPRDPHLDPAIQPPNCQHDHFPPSSMWTNTISSWSHGQWLDRVIDHFTVSFWSFDHVKHLLAFIWSLDCAKHHCCPLWEFYLPVCPVWLLGSTY